MINSKERGFLPTNVAQMYVTCNAMPKYLMYLFLFYAGSNSNGNDFQPFTKHLVVESHDCQPAHTCNNS